MKELQTNGYQLISNVYSELEVNSICEYIDKAQLAQQFGIRSFLKKHTALLPLIFNQRLQNIIQSIDPSAQLIKSIYFDKPPNANWIVNWHQDLTINVDGKTEKQGFKNWRVRDVRTIVQPPLDCLQNIFTIRIHLDDCKRQNGALQVIPKSHLNGVVDIKNWRVEQTAGPTYCEIEKGGILLMKPLTLHASRRTENNQNRRIIHLEMSSYQLPETLAWNESIKS